MLLSFETIETPRLILRKMTDEDYAQVIANCADEEIMQILGFKTEAELIKEKSRQPKGYSTFNKSLLLFHLIEKATLENIGWCGFHTWYREHNRAEIGYSLRDDKYKRRGFMSEALDAVIEYGWYEMNLHRMEAMAASYNTPSIKLLENAGFTFEGTLREHYLVQGVYEDSQLYGLLKDK